MKDIRLKNNKSFRGPSIFFNPQTEPEGRIIRETIAQYPIRENGTGLENIDGFLVFAKDWKNVSKGLALQQASLSANRPIQDRVLVIPFDLEFLLRGIETDRQKMYNTGIFDTKLKPTLEDVVAVQGTNERNDRMINEIYPLLDTRTNSQMLRQQLDNNVDILTMSAVPITSTRQIDRQIVKAQGMIDESYTLLENVFTAYSNDKIDTMNYLAVSASVIKPENYNKIISVLTRNAPHHIGLRVTNLNQSNENQIINVFNFVAELHDTIKTTDKEIPIHLIGFDHLSYLGWAFGVSAVTLPLVTDPYFFGKRGDSQPTKPRKGAYYHPEDRTFYTIDVLFNKTRPDYTFPCYCDICQKYRTIVNVPDNFWNDFRRVHTILMRNSELRMIRESPAPTDVALREMFLRSKKMSWTQFLPDKPSIAF